MTAVVYAGNVTEQQAWQKAQAFLKTTNRASLKVQAKTAAKKAPRKAQGIETPCYYVFNIENNQGFVIVSGDDRTEEILGFADSGSFDANNIPDNLQYVLDGLAEEIAWMEANNYIPDTAKRKVPTTVVAGAENKEDALLVQDVFMSDYFRVYTSPDVLGIELGGALKNVIALAAGISDGLGCGDNAKAALITRGIAEIKKLGVAMGGDAETFGGLSGIGDLIVTCSSIHSRNRMAGYYMGQGMTYKEAMDKVKMVVEGVYSAKAALKLSEKYEVEMPIVSMVNELLFGSLTAKDALKSLLTRMRTSESLSQEWK